MAMTVQQTEDGMFKFSGTAWQTTQKKNELLEPYGKQMHNFGIVLRLLPTDEQITALNQQIGNARFVKNRYLNDRIEYYKKHKKVLTVTKYKKEYIPKLKQEYEFLNKSDKFALESAVEQVDNAFTRFYNHESKFPRFASVQKPKGNKYTTKYTNDNIRFLINKNGIPCIKLPKVGEVRFVMPKNAEFVSLLPEGARITKAIITRSAVGYEVSLAVEMVIDKITLLNNIRAFRIVGVDLGLHDFCILHDGEKMEKVSTPRWIKLHEKRLRRFQKALSRKQYDQKTHTGSKNWEKTRHLVAKEQKKTANQRKDFHHKKSRELADKYDVVVFEDLNVQGMMKNRHLSKSIASVGWYSFYEKVKYKMDWQGKYTIKVSQWFPSSQKCSGCGYINKDVKDLNVRHWRCPQCGTENDRDGNAALNIRNEGIRLLQELGVAVVA